MDHGLRCRVRFELIRKPERVDMGSFWVVFLTYSITRGPCPSTHTNHIRVLSNIFQYLQGTGPSGETLNQ